MNERRALVLVLALGGVLVTWAAARYARQVDERQPVAAATAAASDAGSERVTLRFFRNPKPAPAFHLKDLDGRDVSTESLRGKVVIVNFWATWCGPCRAEIPSLIELQKQYADDLVVLGFSVDDPVAKLKPYAKEFQINYPILVGLGREDVQEAFGPLWGIPVSVIIARDGTIQKKHSGIASKEQFEREIKIALTSSTT